MKITLRSLISDQKVREIVSEAIEDSVQRVLDMELMIGEPTGEPVILTKPSEVERVLSNAEFEKEVVRSKKNKKKERRPPVSCWFCDYVSHDYRGMTQHVRNSHPSVYIDWRHEVAMNEYSDGSRWDYVKRMREAIENGEKFDDNIVKDILAYVKS